VRPVQAERGDQPRETVRIVGKTEGFRRIGGSAGTRRVPSDDRELIRKFVQLLAPRAAAVTYVPVQEYERRAVACSFVGDS
jgi:hypothetical protein